jgi:HPt (histidine-containing phosphotransfer) domain-containing protein
MRPLTDRQERTLEALRVAYASELPDKLGRLVRDAAALEAAGYDRMRVKHLHEDAHQLAGSAGVYGYGVLSQCAAALEALTAAALKERPVSAEARLAFIRRLRLLRRALGSASRPRGRRTGVAAPGGAAG